MTAPFPGGNPSDPGYWEVIFDVIPFPVYVVDCTTYDIICANRAMMQRVAVKPGDKCYSAIYQQSAPCSHCRLRDLEKAAATGSNYLEFELFNDLDDRWYQLRETLVAWFDGRRAKYSIAVDISALKEVQNALAEAHAELAIKARELDRALISELEVNQNQRNFLSLVSHEFRMPLSIIGGAAQILEHYVGEQPDARDELGKIGRGVHRMSDLIDVCLAEDRLTSAVAAFQLRNVDLSALLQDIFQEKSEQEMPGRLSLTCTTAPVIQADYALLRVAIANLVDNALKYSPKDSGAVRITLDAENGGYRVVVADRGPGIPEHEADRIFEKFYRSPSATGIRGAGLGLYIVRQIVERHGGHIHARPGATGGSEFVVSLPRDIAAPT